MPQHDSLTVARSAEAVLTVADQAVVRHDRVGAEEDAGALVVAYGVVNDAPAGTGVVVHDPLIARAREVSDREIRDRDTRCLLREGVAVDALAVEDRARGADEGLTILRNQLGELVIARVVHTGLQPERLARGSVQDGVAQVARGPDDLRAGGRGARTLQPGRAADPGGRLARCVGSEAKISAPTATAASGEWDGSVALLRVASSTATTRPATVATTRTRRPQFAV